MALAARSFRLLAVALGAALFSQLPGFTDHYRQNLAGQITQARLSLDEVSRRARAEDLALRAYLEAALADSGQYSRASVQDSLSTLDRLLRLERAERSLDSATPFTQPLAMIWQLDLTTATVTARHYQPNLPLGLGGAAYASSGALLALILTFFPLRRLGLLTGRRAQPKTAGRT